MPTLVGQHQISNGRPTGRPFFFGPTKARFNAAPGLNGSDDRVPDNGWQIFNCRQDFLFYLNGRLHFRGPI